MSVTARRLISDLRRRGVVLEVDGEQLCVEAPAGVLDGHFRTLLTDNKPAILKLLRRERHKLQEAGRRGLVIQWSSEPGWVALHEPSTGEWREVPAREYLPGAGCKVLQPKGSLRTQIRIMQSQECSAKRRLKGG